MGYPGYHPPPGTRAFSEEEFESVKVPAEEQKIWDKDYIIWDGDFDFPTQEEPDSNPWD